MFGAYEDAWKIMGIFCIFAGLLGIMVLQLGSKEKEPNNSNTNTETAIVEEVNILSSSKAVILDNGQVLNVPMEQSIKKGDTVYIGINQKDSKIDNRTAVDTALYCVMGLGVLAVASANSN